MTALTDLTLSEARDGLGRGDYSSRELTAAHIAAIDAAGALNAFVTKTADAALAAADESDARRGRGEVGALEGLPIAIKDLFCTEGVLTTAGSHILDRFIPPYESTVTANLWRAVRPPVPAIASQLFQQGAKKMRNFLLRSIKGCINSIRSFALSEMRYSSWSILKHSSRVSFSKFKPG